LAEFNAGLEILCVNRQGDQFLTTLTELLPRPSAGILDQESST
jgi:hypothetical protein